MEMLLGAVHPLPLRERVARSCAAGGERGSSKLEPDVVSIQIDLRLQLVSIDRFAKKLK
jgi:hypothetical protein